MVKQHRVAVAMELEKPWRRHYSVFAGIQEYAATHANWKLAIASYPEVELGKGGRFDGIIGRITEDGHKAARMAGIPVVNVWIESPVAARVPGVFVDYFAAGRRAAEHLASRGLRHLAHLGYTGLNSSDQHYEGMLEVAREHGLPCSCHRVSHRFDENRGYWLRFVEKITSFQAEWEAPLGVAMLSDSLCRAVASVCLTSGWDVPDQLALVGCGNDLPICTSIDPTLSSMGLGYSQCGFEAARLMDRLLRGRKPPGKILHVAPEELVVRGSSDVFAVGDPQVARALRFMSEHADGALPVPKIAASVGLGRQSLERRFRRHVGRTVNEELIRLRVSKLQRLLLESDAPIKTLSEQAGFGTTVSMHTMFKRHTGMTPKEYRLQHGPRPERDELAGP